MIKKENWLLIHTKGKDGKKMFQINLDVKNIYELISQLKDIPKDDIFNQEVEYYLINELEITNW